MSAEPAPDSHIRIDDEGRAWIAGTNTKVMEVVLDHLANGWSPDEIAVQHYGRLSLAQIHAALAYYYAHRRQFDDQIRRDDEEYESLRAEAGEFAFRKRMRAEGPLP